MEWDLRGSQAVLSILPLYADVQLSHGSEHPVRAMAKSLTKPVLTIFGGSGGGARTKHTGKLLQTNCLMRFMLHNSNKRTLETHPDSAYV